MRWGLLERWTVHRTHVETPGGPGLVPDPAGWLWPGGPGAGAKQREPSLLIPLAPPPLTHSQMENLQLLSPHRRRELSVSQNLLQ